MRKLNNKGITLIVLIVTIIILLILSTITLHMIIGQDGIIAKAQTAKEKTNISQNKENENLNELENKMDKYSIGSRNDFMQKELLFSKEDGWTNGEITLQKPWTEYSQLLIVGVFSSSVYEWSEKYVSKETLSLLQRSYENNKSSRPNGLLLCEFGNGYITLNIVNESTLKIVARNSPSAIYYIYGIK